MRFGIGWQPVAHRKKQGRSTGSGTFEIVGIVDDAGATAGRGQGGEWSVVFTLAPWRRPGTPVARTGLRVYEPLEQVHAVARASQFPPGTRVRLLVAPTGGRLVGARVARLVRELDPASEDVEIASLHGQLKAAYSFDVEGLGHVVLDRALDAFVGQVRFAGHDVTVYVAREASGISRDRDADRSVLRDATERLRRAESRWREISESVVDGLRTDCAEGWGASARAELSRSLRPAEVAVDEQRVTIYMKGGEQLRDQVVEARLDRDGAVTEVERQPDEST